MVLQYRRIMVQSPSGNHAHSRYVFSFFFFILLLFNLCIHAHGTKSGVVTLVRGKANI